MIVCVCHRVSDRDITSEVNDGCRSFDMLQAELGVGTSCGACAECARDVFDRQCAVHAQPATAVAPAASQGSSGWAELTLWRGPLVRAA